MRNDRSDKEVSVFPLFFLFSTSEMCFCLQVLAHNVVNRMTFQARPSSDMNYEKLSGKVTTLLLDMCWIRKPIFSHFGIVPSLSPMKQVVVATPFLSSFESSHVSPRQAYQTAAVLASADIRSVSSYILVKDGGQSDGSGNDGGDGGRRRH